ncbi:MAG: sigma 54-interacting transcriptional regulator [Bryobacterales bacterium]
MGPSGCERADHGEHSTGKEVVAQTLHQVSQRAGEAVRSPQHRRIGRGRLRERMFGHVKGAFTGADKDRMGRFELADEGTLFLDEIANITPQQQARLLRVLEAGEVERVGASKSRKIDVRILSANAPILPAMIAEERVPQRPAVPVEHGRDPPAAAARRAEDIRSWRLFPRKAVRRYRKPVEGFDDSALRLRAHPWPGNVREARPRGAARRSDGRQRDRGRQGSPPRRPAPRLEDMSLDEVGGG